MRKKVLFVIWSFSMGGGAEKILANILNQIDLTKYDVDVLEYIKFDIKNEMIPENINRLSPILNYTKNNKYKRFLMDYLVKHCPKLIRKIFLNKKYDIEISFNEQIPCFLLDNKTKTFCWIHGDISHLKKYKHLYKKQKKVFRNCQNIISISENTYQSIVSTFPSIKDKILIIYNGFDFDKMNKLSQMQCSIKVEEYSLLFIGRLEDGKNPLDTIKCLKRLHEINCPFHLYVLGQGELLEKMKSLTKRLSLEKYVHYEGYVENPFPIIKQATAILSFSRSEGFPTIFVEGLALGVPFISTYVGGVKELSNNGKCGKIVSSIDEATKILKIVYSQKLKFNRKDCINHVSKFTIDNQIKQLEKLLDSN